MPDITSYNGIDMADIASINGQDAPSGGTASTAPSVSVSINAFGTVTATITKSGGGAYTNPNYSASAALTSDASTVTVADANVDRSVETDGSHLAGTLTFSDSNAASGERTLSVRAQEFGDKIQSDAGTAAYTAAVMQDEYLRIRGTTSDGTASSNRLAIAEVRFYAGRGQTGTVYPTTNLTANDSETDIVISAGHVYNATYDAWKACDSNATGTMYWALGTSAANNWWQIQWEDGTYDTKPIIQSMKIYFHNVTDCTHFSLVGSSVADHSSDTTDYGVFEITSEDAVLNFG